VTTAACVPGQAQGPPYFRIEALGGSLKLSGREMEATFPATVYEPGVLFLRVTIFRQFMATMRDVKMLAIQVNAGGMSVENVHLSLEAGDMLLYPDVAGAPSLHPTDRLQPAPEEPAPKKPEAPGLFDQVP
jgi:hypothetical protein